jgi:gliding motility-associated-like protein
LMTNYGDNSRGEIMLDNYGNCLVASCTRSLNFPVVTPFQSTNSGKQDGVIFKLSSNLSNLLWSSYFGGSSNDVCFSVKIDSSNHIIFAGGTSSIDLPTNLGVWKPSYCGGKTDGFVGKISSDGLNLMKVSYVGTSNYDQTFFVEIDRNDNVFLLGQSEGGIFPVINANFVVLNSSQYVCKLDSSLSTLLNSTVFGNGSLETNISPAAFLVDICGNLYISGWGSSVFGNQPPLSGMPISANAFQANTTGNDFYLLLIDRKFNSMLYGTYIGGDLSSEHVDGGTSRFDKNGVIYQSVCGGCGHNSDFPTTTDAWSHLNLSSNCNNVVFKFDFEIRPKSKFTTASLVVCKNHPLAIQMTDSIKNSDTFLWDFGNGNTNITDKKPYAIYLDTGVFRIKLFVTDSVCLLVDSMFIDIKVIDDVKLQLIPSQFEICKPIQSTLIANSFGTADYFIWSTNKNFTDTLNISVSDSTYSTLISHSGYLYVKAGNSSCFKTDSLLINVISSNISLSGNTKICKKDISEISIENSTPSISFNYVWLPSNIISSNISNNKIKVTPDSTQYLYLLADNNLGCSFKDSILIQVSDIDSTFYDIKSSEIFVPRAETISLSVTPSSNGFTYAWTPSSVVQSPTSQQTTAKLNETTLFTLSVTDGICTKFDSVLVKVFPYVCDDPSVFIPNAFSPNGDGNNDVLVVRGKMIKEMTFRVFDRWGELIFETHERGIGWDGTYKGKKLDPDVYDYYLKVTCIDDIESIVKGNVTLLK